MGTAARNPPRGLEKDSRPGLAGQESVFGRAQANGRLVNHQGVERMHKISASAFGASGGAALQCAPELVQNAAMIVPVRLGSGCRNLIEQRLDGSEVSIRAGQYFLQDANCILPTARLRDGLPELPDECEHLPTMLRPSGVLVRWCLGPPPEVGSRQLDMHVHQLRPPQPRRRRHAPCGISPTRLAHLDHSRAKYRKVAVAGSAVRGFRTSCRNRRGKTAAFPGAASVAAGEKEG
jgi:hypothetical protein